MPIIKRLCSSFQNPEELPEVLRPDSGNATAREAAMATLIRELDLFDLANLEADPLEFVKQLQQELKSEKEAEGKTTSAYSTARQ